MQSQINNLSTSWGHADNPGSWATSSSDKSKMLTYTEADNLGLPRNAKLGDVEVGTDGVPYRYMTYTPTGNNHWFRPQKGLKMNQDKLAETLGTTKFGNDGNIYVLKLYSPTGRKHWYRTELS